MNKLKILAYLFVLLGCAKEEEVQLWHEPSENIFLHGNEYILNAFFEQKDQLIGIEVVNLDNGPAIDFEVVNATIGKSPKYWSTKNIDEKKPPKPETRMFIIDNTPEWIDHNAIVQLHLKLSNNNYFLTSKSDP